jgi:CheY-like chemotaxis protein
MAHILIVDDEANIRRMVRKYAEFYEYQVTEAADGIEAVNLCRTNNYDAVVMDIMMPELEGSQRQLEILKINSFLCSCTQLVAKNRTKSTVTSSRIEVNGQTRFARELMLRRMSYYTKHRLQQSDSSCTEAIEKPDIPH